jgi:hypothetical protein
MTREMVARGATVHERSPQEVTIRSIQTKLFVVRFNLVSSVIFYLPRVYSFRQYCEPVKRFDEADPAAELWIVGTTVRATSSDIIKPTCVNNVPIGIRKGMSVDK